MSRKELQIQCGVCSHNEPINQQSMVATLRKKGLLQKIDNPEPMIVQELFSSHLKNVVCPECKALALVVAEGRNDSRDWGEDQKCEKCGDVISDERLEIFPKAKRCAACQESTLDDDQEYCPKCGGNMTVQKSLNKGIARYSMTCLDCGYFD